MINTEIQLFIGILLFSYLYIKVSTSYFIHQTLANPNRQLAIVLNIIKNGELYTKEKKSKLYHNGLYLEMVENKSEGRYTSSFFLLYSMDRGKKNNLEYVTGYLPNYVQSHLRKKFQKRFS